MFNDKFGLTQAVLDGRKTMTRRIVTPQPTYSPRVGICWKGWCYGIQGHGIFLDFMNFITGTKFDKSCRRYREGETLAIAQCYRDILSEVFESDSNILSRGASQHLSGWHNKMFVKASEMPHRIMISRVCLERLQDISDEDCIKEGICYNEELATSKPYGVFNSFGSFLELGSTPRQAFSVLIDKVSGRGVWDSNPFVFLYEFTLVQ